MATIKFKLVEDETFNDYLGTIQFKYGICEFDASDTSKMRQIENLRMQGFKLENYVGETPNPYVPAIPPPTGKKAKAALKKEKAAAARAKRKKEARAKAKVAKAKAKAATKAKTQVVKPNEQATPSKESGNIYDKAEKVEDSTTNSGNNVTEEKVEQSKDKPESDGKGRSGNTGKNDTVSKTDS